MNFLFIKAIEKKIPVLFETREERYYFDGYDSLQVEDIDNKYLKKHSRRKEVLLLHDHEPKKEPRFIEADHCFTVAPVSPDSDNYNEFIKHNCAQMFLPIPTKDEIIAMNSILQVTDMKLLLERIEKFGCITRRVFATDEDYHISLLTLQAKIQAFNLDVCSSAGMLALGTIPSSKEDFLSWWIFHINASVDLVSASSITWASEYVRKKVIEKYSKTNLFKLESFLANEMFREYSLYNCTREYEEWVCLRISSGFDIKTKLPKLIAKNKNGSRTSDKFDENEDIVSIQKHDLHLMNVKPNKELFEYKEKINEMIQCKRENEPLIDALLFTAKELLLFQITTGKNHDIKYHILQDYVKLAKENGFRKIRYIFIVPIVDEFHLADAQINFFSSYSDKDMQLTLEVLELCPKTIYKRIS
jgi:hypothetical protein